MLTYAVDFAEVTFRGADELRKVFGVVKEPAIIFVKEKDGQPLRYAGVCWCMLTYADVC